MMNLLNIKLHRMTQRLTYNIMDASVEHYMQLAINAENSLKKEPFGLNAKYYSDSMNLYWEAALLREEAENNK